MRPMRWGLVVLGVALALSTSCGRGEEGDAPLLDVGDEQAREQAADALAALDALEEQIEELEQRVESLEDERVRTSKRLDRATERLWSSLSNLRAAVADAKAAGDSASSDVASALGQADAAARAIAVLDNRFEYHLRQHGGS